MEQKNRIMVVDDEVDFLRIVKLNLEETGKYEVLTLSSVKDIISMLNMFKPDVILLDLIMRVGGIEVYEILRKDPIGKNIPIIIVSGLEEAADKLKIHKRGVVDYIAKPIEKDDLIAKIEKECLEELKTMITSTIWNLDKIKSSETMICALA